MYVGAYVRRVREFVLTYVHTYLRSSLCRRVASFLELSCAPPRAVHVSNGSSCWVRLDPTYVRRLRVYVFTPLMYARRILGSPTDLRIQYSGIGAYLSHQGNSVDPSIDVMCGFFIGHRRYMKDGHWIGAKGFLIGKR